VIWTPDQVLEQSTLWVSPWYPPNSTHVVADGYELYIVGSEAMLMAYRGVLQDRAEIIDGAVKVAADYRAMSLRVTVGPDEPGAEPALPELSTATDITVVATIDILAMDRDGFDSRHTPTPGDVEVIEVRTYVQVVEYERTSALAWGYPATDRRRHSVRTRASDARFVPCVQRRDPVGDSRLHACRRRRTALGCGGGARQSRSRGVPVPRRGPSRQRVHSRGHPCHSPRRTDVVTDTSALGLQRVRPSTHIRHPYWVMLEPPWTVL
jgi:hypothetical protein